MKLASLTFFPKWQLFNGPWFNFVKYSHPLKNTLPIRNIKSSASELRKGDYINYDGKAMVISNISSSCSGRGSRTFSIQLKCIINGNVSSVKPSGDESFEKMEIQDKIYQYLYHDDKLIYLCDPNTFEQLEVNISLIPHNLLSYLESGVQIRVRMRSDTMDPILISTNKNLHCTVQKIISKDSLNKNNVVELSSGAKIICPSFIEENEKVIVDFENGTYLNRATS